MPDAAGMNTELREGTKIVWFLEAQLNREMKTVKHRRVGSKIKKQNNQNLKKEKMQLRQFET